jgi:hypothetical protein
MAALDFGMALARGMLPTTKKAQEDLLDLAGGRNVFKSESWWQEQVDKQIDKGYRKQDYQTQYLVDTGLATSWFVPKPSGVTEWRPGKMGFGGIIEAPKGAVWEGYGPGWKRNYTTRELNLGFGTGRDWFKSDELKNIEKGAKRGAEQVKRKSAEQSASRKRLSRATGGLVGKATTPGAAPATGLPALGTTGFGRDEKTLGKGLLV